MSGHSPVPTPCFACKLQQTLWDIIKARKAGKQHPSSLISCLSTLTTTATLCRVTLRPQSVFQSLLPGCRKRMTQGNWTVTLLGSRENHSELQNHEGTGTRAPRPLHLPLQLQHSPMSFLCIRAMTTLSRLRCGKVRNVSVQ